MTSGSEANPPAGGFTGALASCDVSSKDGAARREVRKSGGIARASPFFSPPGAVFSSTPPPRTSAAMSGAIASDGAFDRMNCIVAVPSSKPIETVPPTLSARSCIKGRAT